MKKMARPKWSLYNLDGPKMSQETLGTWFGVSGVKMGVLSGEKSNKYKGGTFKFIHLCLNFSLICLTIEEQKRPHMPYGMRKQSSYPHMALIYVIEYSSVAVWLFVLRSEQV